MTTTPHLGNRRQQILEEATALFAESGYSGTSIRTIARACGITEAAIYRHFRNKADLYEEVIRTKAAQHDIAGQLAGLNEDGSLLETLTEVAHHILALGKNDSQLMRLMVNNSLQEGTISTVLFREIRLPYIEFLTRDLERRLDRGRIREVEPFITARCFVGMVMDCALNVGAWARITETRFEAGDVVCNNVPIFARGLLNDPAASVAPGQPGSAT